MPEKHHVEVVGNILSRLGAAWDTVIASATCRKWPKDFDSSRESEGWSKVSPVAVPGGNASCSRVLAGFLLWILLELQCNEVNIPNAEWERPLPHVQENIPNDGVEQPHVQENIPNAGVQQPHVGKANSVQEGVNRMTGSSQLRDQVKIIKGRITRKVSQINVLQKQLFARYKGFQKLSGSLIDLFLKDVPLETDPFSLDEWSDKINEGARFVSSDDGLYISN